MWLEALYGQGWTILSHFEKQAIQKNINADFTAKAAITFKAGRLLIGFGLNAVFNLIFVFP